jgi:hypothetical protein
VVCRSAVLIAGLAVALSAGCSAKKGGAAQPKPSAVQGSQVASFIEQELAGRFPGLTVGSASCPATLALTPDKPEFCRLQIEGQPVRIKVVGATGNGQYTVANDQAVVRVADLEDKLRSKASGAAGVSLDVDCGDRAVLIFDPPKTIQCLVRPPGKSPVIYDVTINDAQGNFSFAPHRDAGG